MGAFPLRAATGALASCSYSLSPADISLDTRTCRTSFQLHPVRATTTLGQLKHVVIRRQRSHGRRCRGTHVYTTMAATQKSFYEVLGVPKTATLDEVKKAYRQKALSLHPDVNKAPDANERFMECKMAWQTLSNAKTRAEYDRQQNGGGGQGFDFNWDDFMGAKSAGASARKATEDAFYSFSDFWRDVEKDLDERNKRRGGKPASLWEELGELGGEFLEFLEKELGLPPEDTAGRKANREAAQAKAEEAASQARTAQEDAKKTAEKAAERASSNAVKAARSASEDIDDMLADLKKKLGMS